MGVYGIGNCKCCKGEGPCTGTFCLDVTRCGSSPVLTVTVRSNPGGGGTPAVMGVCVLDSSGYCCVAGLAPGNYTYDVTGGGTTHAGGSFTVNAQCDPVDRAITIGGTVYPVNLVIAGCVNPHCRAGWTFTVEGTYGSGSGTTDADGACTIWMPGPPVGETDNLTIGLTSPYRPYLPVVVEEGPIGECQEIGVFVSVATLVDEEHFVCVPTGLPGGTMPAPKVLHWTDPCGVSSTIT